MERRPYLEEAQVVRLVSLGTNPLMLTSALAEESGIDQSVTNKFPGSTAEYGSKVSGAGNNREIPPEEGGDVVKGSGRMTKAGDFDQGEAGEGPEDVAARQARDAGGDDSVRDNIRQHAPQKHTS